MYTWKSTTFEVVIHALVAPKIFRTVFWVHEVFESFLELYLKLGPEYLNRARILELSNDFET